MLQKESKNNENTDISLYKNNDDTSINSNSNNNLSIKKSPRSLKSQKLEHLKFLTDLNPERRKNINLSGPLKCENEPDKQLLYYFKDKKIYIEIFNGNINSSPIFYNILLKYKIIQCKKLSKKIDYIVFKDGHLKTKKYAVLNGIKMVNPLWIDDKVNNHIFKDDKEYEIQTNFGDIVLREKYEKNKLNQEKEDNNNNTPLIQNKNFELELEAEYDTEYANMIDKMRENNSQKNEISVLSTINLTNKEDNEESFKDDNFNMNLNIDSNNDIKREKRRSNITKYKRKTIMVNDENNNNILKESNDNTKMNNKKKPKRNKKKLSENDSQKTNKQRKIEINENNYILDFSQNSDKVLSISKNKEEKDEKSNVKKTLEKINIITYKLGTKEIQCLKSLNNFEYKGNLANNEDNEKNKNLYDSSNIILLEKDKCLYDWKLYEFLFDKKIIIDFTLFLFEFIGNDNNSFNNMDEFLEKINQISVNNECYFFNKKIRLQKRSMLQSLNIVDNLISKEKGESINQQINENDSKFYFLLNQDIQEDEKKILQKLLKNYLKANIININIPKKRPKSVTSQININLKKIEKKSKKNINLEVIKESQDINNDENKNQEEQINKQMNSKENENKINDKKEDINEEQKIEGTFLISKEKINSIKFLKKVKYYKGVISCKYIYDSFLNGQLLDLNDKDILEKYQLQ